ncbi:MAG: 2-phosphosulfolactate phosphatase [Candidatus Rokubacteria bacterium]|nr:2-phosphosulfolactate phosphatase [Candidatus Rokubacteria bacterium]
MRVHVALCPSEFRTTGLADRTALVVDVLRASTTVVAACAAGCRGVIPVADAGAARARAVRFPPGTAVLAGEQGGDPLPGFDLGNSPLEFTPARIAGRTVILTTTNGTAAMLAAAGAAGAAVAAMTNLDAVAGWVLARDRDVTVLCAGEQGAFSLEDAVCAGLLVARLAAGGRLEPSDAATAALRLGEHYGPRLDLLRRDCRWARTLGRKGRDGDVSACLTLGGIDIVPVLCDGMAAPDRSDGGAPPVPRLRPVPEEPRA